MTSSSPGVFAARRHRLSRQFTGEAVLLAGLPRPRNSPSSFFPFRAESHFLYLVGTSLPSALLWVSPRGTRLYCDPPDPAERLWSGPRPSLADLERSLEIEVRPLAELPRRAAPAVLPPMDEATAAWASALLGRAVVAGAGASLKEADAELAEAMVSLRLHHDVAALAQLRLAAAATAEAFRVGLTATRPGPREGAVRGAMLAVLETLGMTPAFSPIVTTHGDVLHELRSDRSLVAGALLLADFGAETPEGWAADVSRTWPVGAVFSPTQRELYAVVLAAQRAAIAAVAPGVRFAAVHAVAQRTLVGGLVELGILTGDPEELQARGAAAMFFPHGVGHLLGLDVHDLEDLGDRAAYDSGATRSSAPGLRHLRLDRVLEPGMVVTIEPGLYRLPVELLGELGPVEVLTRRRWDQYADVRGIRIEDDVLVTADGAELLTAAIPRSLAEVEAARRG